MEREGSRDSFLRTLGLARKPSVSSNATLVNGEDELAWPSRRPSTAVGTSNERNKFPYTCVDLNMATTPYPLHSDLLSILADDPPGLTAVWTSPRPTVDIIFIHGLGGTPAKTWYHEKDPSTFWPSWLHEEPELLHARVHTFGYSAKIVGAANSSGIFDFARDLLFKMKYEYVGNERGPPIGKIPIIFVAHSMGGLVAKMAYNTAINDDDYRDMIAQVKAIIFLSTPHQGCGKANCLDNLLGTFNLSHNYIRELSANGAILQQMNHEFSNTCRNLKLFSFYETAKTFKAGVGAYIVDKDSGVTNLANEAKCSMAVGHHDICKFRHKEEQGYKYIRNILIDLTMPLLRYEEADSQPPVDLESQIQKLGDALSINEDDLADEFDRFLNEAMTGTCAWIEQRPWFQSWLRPDSNGPRILWLSGPPAAGKSVLAATTVDKIRSYYGEESCQYHNLSFADRDKRSASYLLRSLAYQVAQSKTLFLRKLLQLSDQLKHSFRDMVPRLLWEKIFLGLLFHLMSERPLYWVIDGLDESDSIPAIFQCLNKIESDSLTLKILLVSRPTADISRRMKGLPQSKLHVHHISHEDTKDDIRTYVTDVVPRTVPGSPSDHAEIMRKILSKASGNFFWVVHVLKALEKNWYRKSDIDRVINKFHSDMSPMYAKMMQKLNEQTTEDRKMASMILTWATFSFRPHTTSELRIALEPESNDLTSLEDYVRHVCAGFVQVHASKVGLTHETAKHFLIHETAQHKVQMVPSKAHEQLAIVCLRHLSSSKERQWRTILKNLQDDNGNEWCNFGGNPDVLNKHHPFLLYAAQSWAYHLSLARTESSSMREMLLEFFKKDALTWINTLALLGDLATLTKSANYLKTFIKRREKMLEDTKSKQLQHIDSDDLKAWAKDLSRVVGKFGGILLSSPSSIYKLIPPFCPDTSMIKKFYAKAHTASQSAFLVAGLSNPDWDDCHARRSVDPDEFASQVLATIDFFVAMVPMAHSVVLWHTETCEQYRRLVHGEYLLEMAINNKGDLICTSGLKTIIVWDIATGSVLASIPITCDTRVIAITFGSRDDNIITGYQDHTVISYNWRTSEKTFEFQARSEGDFFGGLNHMKFSPDGTQVAFGSKGVPIEIWDLRRKSRAYRFMIEQDAVRGEDENLVFPEAIEWHPDGDRLYLLYHNLRLVDWNPVFEEQQEYQVTAKDMVCSPCGNFLLTSDARGAIRVYSLPKYGEEKYQRFRLIYHLEYEGLVRDLAFHPDGQRFYDVRGTVCNVWQPEALVLADEPSIEDDDASTSGSLISSGPAEAFQEDCCQITAIASGPQDSGFCCGREDGTLSIHDLKTTDRLRALPGHSIDAAIIGLVWSRSGNWIASADDSGHVVIRRVQMPSPRHPKLLTWKPVDFHVHDGVIQLLMSPNDERLLVAGSSSVCLFDVRNKTLIQSRESAIQRRVKWLQHPLEDDRIIQVGADKVHIFEWDQLRPVKPLCGYSLHRQRTGGDVEISDTPSVQEALEGVTLHPSSVVGTNTTTAMPEVNCVIQTRDRQSIIFETSHTQTQGFERLSRKRVELFRTSSLDHFHDQNSDDDDLNPLTASSPGNDLEYGIHVEILPSLCDGISRLVGIYKNQIVFFSQQHWLCSWEIDSRDPGHRKHLALPQDWLNEETTKLTSLSPTGTLLCPRNGEVAVIKGGIKL